MWGEKRLVTKQAFQQGRGAGKFQGWCDHILEMGWAERQ